MLFIFSVKSDNILDVSLVSCVNTVTSDELNKLYIENVSLNALQFYAHNIKPTDLAHGLI
jgi:hypothetical protein